MDKKTARVINAVTGSKLELEESEEEVNMCRAIAEMREDERRAGETKKLINQVRCKIIKGKTVDVIADELEEEAATIEPIYHAALQCAPEYDCDAIYNLLMEQLARKKHNHD